MNRITRLLLVTLTTFTVVIGGFTFLYVQNLSAAAVNCQENPDAADCADEGYNGPSENDFTYGFNGTGGDHQETVQAGEQVTIFVARTSGTPLDTSCPSTTVKPAFKFVAPWTVPSTNYTTEGSFANNVLLQATIVAQEDWDGDSQVSQDPDSIYYEEPRAWTYQGVEVAPVMQGSDPSADPQAGWQFGNTTAGSYESKFWTFNAPDVSSNQTYTINVWAGDAIDKFYNQFDCNTFDGGAYHDYSIGSVNSGQLTLNVVATDTPDPSASLSVREAGTGDSYSSSLTVQETTDGSNNAQFRTECINAVDAELSGPDGFLDPNISLSSGTPSYSLTTSNSGTFTLTCTADDGDIAESTASVTVTAPPSAGDINISAPSTVVEGETFPLTWSSSNMDSVLTKSSSPSISAWNGIAQQNGSESQTLTAPSVSSNQNYTFTVSGTGNDGNPVSDSVTVTVQNDPQGTIRVNHGGASEASSARYSITPSVVSNKSIARGALDSHSVSPASGGTIYTFSAESDAEGTNGPFISINGGSAIETTSRSFYVEDGDLATVTFYYEEAPASSGTLRVTSSCPVSVPYTLGGTGDPSSINGTVPSGGTNSHTITINGSSDNYSINVTDPSGYDASVTPSAHSLTVGDTDTFSISCTATTPEATINVNSDSTTDYTLTDAGGGESISDQVLLNETNTHTVSPTGGSESYTLTPEARSGYTVEVTNTKTSSTNGVVTVDDGDTITYSIDYTGTPGTCNLSSNKSSISSGEAFTLTWSGTNLSFATAQDSAPSDGVWGNKSVSTAGGSETITGPTLNPGDSQTLTYSLLCGYTNGTQETTSVSVTASEPANPLTIQVTANQDTVFSVIPDDTESPTGQMTSTAISAGETKTFTMPGTSSGKTYSISYNTLATYEDSVSSYVNGSPSGGSSAIGGEGDTILFDIEYTGGTPDVDINANPTQAEPGDSTTLSWTTSNASSCTASGDWSGSKSTSGSESQPNLTSGTKTYTLTCTSSDGATGSDSATVSVSSNPLNVSIWTLPSSNANVGESVEINWSSNFTTSCTASGDWSGSKATFGEEESEVFTEPTTKMYSIVCSDGSGNSGSDTAYLDVHEVTQCNDGVDNDGDGDIDYPADSDCDNESDDSESPPAQCTDGIDNDGDGDVDYPNDPSCSSDDDNDELNPQPQFSVTLSPTSITFEENATTSEATSIMVSSVDGYSEDVVITAEYVGDSPGGTTFVHPNAIQAGTSEDFVVESTAPLGTAAEYTIEITASGDLQDGSTLVIRRNLTLVVEGGIDPVFEEF